MRSASLQVLAFFGVAAIVVACAESDPGPATEEAPAEPAAVIPVTDAGTTAKDPVCPSKCSADSDCQKGCPSASSGVYCCDGKTSTCYAYSSATCPAPPAPDGGPISSY